MVFIVKPVFRILDRSLSLRVARDDPTCIVIAHWLSTIRNADQIAVIENQGISEIGSRQELLALDGVYAALERAQEMAG